MLLVIVAMLIAVGLVGIAAVIGYLLAKIGV